MIAYSFMLSRTLSGLSVVTFPQARKKGMVADFSESASTRITRMVLGIYLIVLCFLIPLTGGICGIGCDLGRRGIWILLPDGDEEFRRCDRGSVWIFPAGM